MYRQKSAPRFLHKSAPRFLVWRSPRNGRVLVAPIARGAGLGDLTGDLAQAIARFEGYNVAGSVAQRNNNPGNLRAGVGQVGTDAGGYAVFATSADGWNALENQIGLNVNRGLTLDEFFAGKTGVYPGYAPSGDANNPTNYANTVAGWIGIDPTVPLEALEGSAAIAPSSAAAGAIDTAGLDLSSLIPGSSSGLSGTTLAAVAGLAVALVALLLQD